MPLENIEQHMVLATGGRCAAQKVRNINVFWCFSWYDLCETLLGQPAQPSFLKWPFKIVFGHNLQHMAPFAIPNTRFCMVFQRASLFFSCPGMDFWAQDQIFGSRVDILARGPFLAKQWPRKKSEFVTESFCHGNSGEIPNTKWILLYIGPIWVGYFAPNPLCLIIFQGFTIFQKNWGAPQPVPWAIA